MASNRLWVGGFDRYIEKNELQEVFGDFGTVVDIWVACDPPGYAFIEFETDEQANSAIAAMNQTICLGCKITVQTSKKSGHAAKKAAMAEKAQGSRIYVGNIVEKINVGQLNAAFEEFGNIVDISVNKDGYAYIEFESDGEAARAVEETNGTEIFGGFLQVEITNHKGNEQPVVSKKQAPPAGRVAGSRVEGNSQLSSRLFVGNLSREVAKEELSALFEGYGKIKEIWVPYTFKGYCFLEFEEEEPAKLAVTELNGTEQDFSDALKVEATARKKPDYNQSGGRVESRSNASAGRPVEPRLFVGNIKEEIEKTDLKAVFEPYGNITDIWIAFNPPGFAFVQFDTMESAKSAIEGVNGMEAFGGRLKVDLTASRRRDREDKSEYRPGPRRPYPGPPPRHHPYARPSPVAARRPPPFRSLRGRAPRPAAAPRAVSRYAYPPPAADPYYDDPYYAAEQEYADPYYAAAPAVAAPAQDSYYYDEPYYRPDPLNIRASDHPSPARGRGRGARARPPPAPATSSQIPYSEEFY